ncbi:Glycosyltransferase involved in cell wall bisynthesis [Cyclobacterium lianum]|uniref:Glycosyltransferase involved in cell wall bisynthesis n=1 Tax=Cyclobacterium lianum TaxID=388280 RepID=A0A1M7JX09_9BACT|nr:glycosyltransferase family 4 protein [Cyclobacterium lianum]SHM57077.1 Glycosyltransferase involved in cell wall bisynthesis [Cyclobacterium lianum]
MRITYIHQYYLRPDQGGAIRSFHIAQGITSRGIEVEVITSHQEAQYAVRWDGKVKVHLLPVPYDNEYSTIRRLWSFYSFVKGAKRLIGKNKLPDLFYISSTPLSTGEIGRWAKKKWGIPFVFEIRDLWPEAPIQVRQIRNKLLKKWLYRREYDIYSEADSLVSLSPGIQAHIRRMLPNKPIEMVPNFSDTTFFRSAKTVSPKRDFGFRPLTILYAGAIGQVNGLYQFLDLAAAAEKRGKNWHFLLMGKGNQLSRLKREAKARKLDKVKFLPFGDKFEVRKRMNQADLAYVSFLPLQVLQLSSPNKFFDALAAGLPVIVNFGGWIWDLVQTNSIGFYHDCADHESLIAALAKLEASEKTLLTMAGRARELAENEFDKQLMIRRIWKILAAYRLTESVESPGFVS